MNFKKNVIVGLITTALFSISSFAMDTESDKKIVVITENTTPEAAAECGITPSTLNKMRLYLLMDKNKTIYSSLFLDEGNNLTDLHDVISSLYPDTKSHLRIEGLCTSEEYKRQGYGKLLLKNVLDSYKDAVFYLEDECNICQHEKGFCFYVKFGFMNVIKNLREKAKIKIEEIKEKYDFKNILILKKGNDNVDYQGKKEGLEKLPIIEI